MPEIISPIDGRSADSYALLREVDRWPKLELAAATVRAWRETDLDQRILLCQRMLERGSRLAEDTEAGTVFLNRGDDLDPGLAWTGIKDSGFGCSRSSQAFLSVTRPKSFHLRNQPT